MGPDNLLRGYIDSALEQADIAGKVTGWHSFRYSVATNLRSDTRAISEKKRQANARVVEMNVAGSRKIA